MPGPIKTTQAAAGQPPSVGATSSNNIPIASWSLQDPDASERTESSFKLEYENEADAEREEAVFKDHRKVVEQEHIRPGGKYRNIIKLLIRYEGNPAAEAMGTGWLIAPDVLVTAGHCVFDWSMPYNRAISVRAYMGYNGQASINTPNVSYRYATRAATTVRWIAAKGTRPGDFAVLKLNKPFDARVPPVDFKATPMKGLGDIGVVGYPGDKTYRGEAGAQMYEMFTATPWDRSKAENKMLDYVVSTYAGQSGSPVLLRENGTYTSIGVHTYGGRKTNSATVLDNENNVTTYRAFCLQEMWKDSQYETTAAPGLPKSVSVYSIPIQESAIGGPQETEGFFDVFKKVLNVALPIANTVVSVGGPLMGPIGAVVAPLAGVALQAASKLTESSFEKATESQIKSTLDSEGAVHRAILCEAAIQALGRMDEDTLRNSGALKTMSQVYATHSERVKNLTPHLSKALLEPSLRVSMDQLRIAHNPVYVPPNQLKKRAPIPGAESFLVGTESALDEGSDATSFVREMITGDAEVVEEFSFRGMLDGIKKAVLVATPLVTSLARTGLDKLDEVMAAKSKTESGFIENPQSVTDILPKRALVGEAALQAVMKLPKEYLHAQYPKPGSDVETEGLIDIMRGVIQKIGPRVIAAAPVVYKTVTPIIKDLLLGPGTESQITRTAPPAAPSKSVIGIKKPLTSKSDPLNQSKGDVKNVKPAAKGSEKYGNGIPAAKGGAKYGNGNEAANEDEDQQEAEEQEQYDEN